MSRTSQIFEGSLSPFPTDNCFTLSTPKNSLTNHRGFGIIKCAFKQTQQYAMIIQAMEKYSRGWRGAPAKGVGRVLPARGFKSLFLRSNCKKCLQFGKHSAKIKIRRRKLETAGFYGKSPCECSDLAKGTKNFIKNLKIKKSFLKKFLTVRKSCDKLKKLRLTAKQQPRQRKPTTTTWLYL